MPSHHLRFIYILQGHCSQRRQLKGGKTGEVRLSVFLLVIFYIKIIPTPDITKDVFYIKWKQSVRNTNILKLFRDFPHLYDLKPVL